MDLNSSTNRGELINIFPALSQDKIFCINSPISPSYNCIAWAMGYDSRWVANIDNPFLDKIAVKFVWWPEGVEISQRCEALQKAFEALGFELTTNKEYEPLYDKAVLYTDGTKWTHASRIVAEGVEHSKFGGLWDAFHSHNVFDNSPYGTPYAYMKRLHSEKQYYLNKHPIRIGIITINEDQLKRTLNMLKSLRKSTI